jgi:hypothetical protein
MVLRLSFWQLKKLATQLEKIFSLLLTVLLQNFTKMANTIIPNLKVKKVRSEPVLNKPNILLN